MRLVVLLAALLPVVAECEQSYRVYTEHPRLWLNARRLRLVKRERERDTVRWQQLQLVSKGKERLPEEPLVRALEYQVSGAVAPGKQAVAWAVGRAASVGTPDAAELRLLAVVFDWCYPLFGEDERKRVVERMALGVAALAPQPGLPAFTSRALAAIALADDWDGSEKALTEAFEKRWEPDLLPALREGRGLERQMDRVALLELCHAARDNLNLDIWNQARGFFRQFPIYLLLEYYPVSLEVSGHLFHQPAYAMSEKPDLAVQGELARRTELLTAAYDTNSNEAQFLQGWLTHDRYRLRSASGALYEFLWMNPYQPGLSYYAAPLHVHEGAGGTLLSRSSWDDDAAWIGYRGGELQLFADGERSLVGTIPPEGPIVFPRVAVARVAGDASFRVRVAEGDDVFVVGLQAGKTYWVKAGDKRFVPETAERGGILSLKVEPGEETAFEIRTTDPNPPPPTLDRKTKAKKK
jgi:hypothetical protein